MMQLCGHVSSSPGGNEGDVNAGVHGGLDARLDAAPIRPANETCPTDAAHGDGERNRHRAALRRNPRNGSESPQAAGMAGEARADRRWRSGGQVPDRQRGPLQSCSALSVRPQNWRPLTSSSSARAACSGCGGDSGRSDVSETQRRAQGRL
jgi:hypothetical protein